MTESDQAQDEDKDEDKDKDKDKDEYERDPCSILARQIPKMGTQI